MTARDSASELSLDRKRPTCSAFVPTGSQAPISEQTRANRVAGARKAAASRKRQAQMRAFMADGAAIDVGAAQGSGPRGAGEKMGFDPSAIIARIKAREAGE